MACAAKGLATGFMGSASSLTTPDLLRQFSDGKYDYFSQERIRYDCCVPTENVLQNDITVSFADGAITGSHMIGLSHFLKAEYPDDVVVPPAKYRSTRVGGEGDDAARWCHVIRSFTYLNPSYNTEKEPESAEYYAGVGMVHQKTALCVCSEGGRQ